MQLHPRFAYRPRVLIGERGGTGEMGEAVTEVSNAVDTIVGYKTVASTL